MKRLAIVVVLSISTALLASGCLWGVVTDADTGAAIPGATVMYTDSEGHTDSTTTNALGFYAFDQATGPIPAAGSATFEVSAPGYETLTQSRVIAYNDNPNATLANPSSFWEIQSFQLAPEEAPGNSVSIIDYTPFDSTMEPKDEVEVRLAYEATGSFDFELSISYQVEAESDTWWCHDDVPISPGAGTLVLGCLLGPLPSGGDADWYPHERGIITARLLADGVTAAGQFIVDDRVCPMQDAWPWFPVCP